MDKIMTYYKQLKFTGATSDFLITTATICIVGAIIIAFIAYLYYESKSKKPAIMSVILLILTVFAFAGAIYFAKEQSYTREKFIHSCVEYANENNKELLFTNKKHEAVIIIDEQSFTIPYYEISIIQDKEGKYIYIK